MTSYQHRHFTGKQHPLAGLWRLTTTYRLKLLTAVSTLALAVTAGTIGHLLLRHFIDTFIEKKDFRLPFWDFSLEPWGYALAFVGLALLRGIFAFLSGRSAATVSEGIARYVRNRMFDHLLKLSFTYHDNTSAGTLIQHSTSDVDKVRGFYAHQIIGLSRIFFLFMINFSVILTLNWQLGLVSIVIGPVVVILSRYVFDRITRAYGNYQKVSDSWSSVLQENLSGVRVVRAFARQQFEIKKFDEKNRKRMMSGRRLMLNYVFYWPVSHFICGLQIMTGIGLGAYFTWQDQISLGTYIAYIGMVNAVVWPLQHLGNLINQLAESFTSFGRIEKIITVKQEGLMKGHYPDRRLKGLVEFRRLDFGYKKKAAVLKNISLRAEPGQVIALLGQSGSGKTSLINLLPGFYRHQGGELLIDNRPIREYSRHFLRRNIGLVEQEPFLFSTTIRENITYGVKGRVSQARIEEIACKAAIHKDIMAMPRRYNTLVGEKGVTLSGGQKQRIAIARALLKDPGILILDDATSAVDAETEDKIRRALRNLMKGRTTFLIAHRIQSLMSAHQILVFRDGRIVQRGSHQELLKKRGFYRNIFDLQTRIEKELKKEIKSG